jgi:uncharacterized membrane protein
VSDPLDARASALRLHALAGAGLLGPEALAAALERIDRRPTVESWYRFARVQLILLGTALAVVGAIFFIAANWDSLPPHVRIGLAAAAMTAATLAGGWIGLTKLTGRAAALAGGLLFGPLMALVGQIYQTGADAWELFAAWTLVLGTYAAAIRFSGAWVCAIVLATVTTYLYIGQQFGSNPFVSPGIWVSLALSVALTAVDLVRRLRRGLGDLVGAVALTIGGLVGLCHGIAAIVVDDWPSGQLPALIWSIGQALVLLWFGLARTPDESLVRGGGGQLLALLAVFEGKVIFDGLDMKVDGLMLMGLLLIVQGSIGGRLLLQRRRQAVQEDEP